MDILLIIVGILLLIAGVVGCILPILPGTPLAYVGLLLIHFTEKVEFTTTELVIWMIIIIAIQVLDYFTPMLGSKYSGGSRNGNRGCVIGTIVGLFFMPWGIFIGPFLGAFIGELLGGSNRTTAIRAGFGSLLGFLMGTFLKLIICLYFIYQCVKPLLG